MDRQYMYFADLPIKSVFVLHGDKCVKQSTRTAKLTDYGHVFYFGQKDLCIVGHYCSI